MLRHSKIVRTMDRETGLWILKTAKKNYWRVSSWYDLDDLIQDGHICFCKCNNKYSLGLTKPHFMSLVMRTYHNHINNLAIKRTRSPDGILTSFNSARYKDVDQALEALAPAEPEGQTFAVLLRQLPSEIQELLGKLINESLDIPMLKWNNGQRETTNQYLWRLIGRQPCGINLQDALRSHFAAT